MDKNGNFPTPFNVHYILPRQRYACKEAHCLLSYYSSLLITLPLREFVFPELLIYTFLLSFASLDNFYSNITMESEIF